MEWTSVKTDLPPAGKRVIATNGETTGEAYIVTVGGVSTWHRGYKVPWESWANKPVIAWTDMLDRNSMTESHSEREIYNGCVDLMGQLMGRFEEYLDFIDVPVTPRDDEEHFCTKFYTAEIVKMLFLWNTSHSGGTSTRMKCRELGISDETVVFEDERELDEED